jgi:anthranilate synthase component I
MTKLELLSGTFETSPGRAAFLARYRQGLPQVVFTRLIADLETPVSAALKLADGKPMSCLLESVEGGAVRGRYSIIGIAPDLVWRARGDVAEINRHALTDPDAFVPEPLPTLPSLRALLAESRITLPTELPAIAAGVIGYMGYDAVRLVEHLPNPRPDALAIPDSIFVRPTLMVVFDSVKDEMIVVTPVYPRPGVMR